MFVQELSLSRTNVPADCSGRAEHVGCTIIAPKPSSDKALGGRQLCRRKRALAHPFFAGMIVALRSTLATTLGERRNLHGANLESYSAGVHADGTTPRRTLHQRRLRAAPCVLLRVVFAPPKPLSSETQRA
jgi:hypothetical protein